MDVTPQLLHDVEFREAKRGGYNTQDVDDFLERLAVGIERQDAQLRELRQRAESADARVAEAERRALDAEQRAVSSSDADETLKRTLVLAQRTADAAIREAQDEAARTLSAAQDEAARLLADAHEASARARADAEDEARRAHQDAQARVLAEMRELEAARDQLRDDVGLLERHVEDQRARLRRAIDTLAQLLEDPAALAEVEVPTVSDVRAPVVERPLLAAPEPAAAPPFPLPGSDDAEAPADWLPDDEVWGDESGTAADTVFDAEAGDEDTGPPTEAVDLLAERDVGDDAYLAELRKAMTDESPLGPREEEDALFDDPSAGRSRFGRRR